MCRRRTLTLGLLVTAASVMAARAAGEDDIAKTPRPLASASQDKPAVTARILSPTAAPDSRCDRIPVDGKGEGAGSSGHRTGLVAASTSSEPGGASQTAVPEAITGPPLPEPSRSPVPPDPYYATNPAEGNTIPVPESVRNPLIPLVPGFAEVCPCGAAHDPSEVCCQCAMCDMVQHHVYYPAMHGYYYFRPYNWRTVPRQQAFVVGWGGDPRNPYSNAVFKGVYAEYKAAHPAPTKLEEKPDSKP